MSKTEQLRRHLQTAFRPGDTLFIEEVIQLAAFYQLSPEYAEKVVHGERMHTTGTRPWVHA